MRTDMGAQEVSVEARRTTERDGFGNPRIAWEVEVVAMIILEAGACFVIGSGRTLSDAISDVRQSFAALR